MNEFWKDPLVKKLLTPSQIAPLQKGLKQLDSAHAAAERSSLRPEKSMEERRGFSLQTRDFFGYVLSFGASERFEAFLGVVPGLSEPEFWKMVRQVWILQETIRPNECKWLELLQSRRACRELLMSQTERTELAAMPDEIKIWRGCGTANGVRGLSWTSDKKRAEFFAEYACGGRREFMTGEAGTGPLVVSAVCRKSDVLAYFTERQESEFVLNPNCLRSVAIQRKGQEQ